MFGAELGELGGRHADFCASLRHDRDQSHVSWLKQQSWLDICLNAGLYVRQLAGRARSVGKLDLLMICGFNATHRLSTEDKDESVK